MALIHQTGLRAWSASRTFATRNVFAQCVQHQPRQHLHQATTRPLFRSTATAHSERQSVRHMATEQPRGNSSSQRSANAALAHHTEQKQWKDLTTQEKVVTATKTTTNYAVIGAGVVLVGAIGYAIISELFGNNSDTHIFGDALEKVRNNEKLTDVLGSPVKGFGEPSSSKRRRNRRIHSQVVLDAEGKEHLLMRFFVEGPDNEGTAHLEMIKDQRGNWEYKYLFVDVPGGVRPAQRIFVEYNKHAGQPAVDDKKP